MFINYQMTQDVENDMRKEYIDNAFELAKHYFPFAFQEDQMLDVAASYFGE